jgi:DNA-binding transcriptional LysR family regulator
MKEPNLGAMDLNLLLVVDAVLRERSATRAAARLHVTQSAVSNALRRARALFGDPLVVRTGRGFATTPRADAIAPRLRAILQEVRGVLGDASSFRPETSTRRFTIAATDAVGMVVLPALLPLFEARLPRAQLRLVTIDHVIASGGLEHAAVDLLIGVPPVIAASCEAEDLFEDPMVAVVRADHPSVGQRLTLATYARLPHAELALFGEPEDRVDRALAARGLRRQVQVTVPHIAGLPFLVAGSDRVATLISSVARTFAGLLELRVLTPPVELAALVVRQIWHRRFGDDPGHRLLRELVRAAVHRSRGTTRVRAPS